MILLDTQAFFSYSVSVLTYYSPRFVSIKVFCYNLQSIQLHALKSLFSKSVIATALLVFSCEQYEYTSPLPGLLEVRLRTINSRQDTCSQCTEFIPFGLSNFTLKLTSLEVKRGDGARLPVYANEYAIGRNSEDGDPYNCLDTLARDSALVLGRTFAPPDVFTNVEFTVSPFFPLVLILDTLSHTYNPIDVVDFQRVAFHRLPKSGGSLNIRVEEGRTTRVTVTINLDSTLVRRLEDFEYRPYFYVSSIQNF